jgi:hypothetical protein
LQKSCATWREEEIEAAFNDLVAEMLLILTRLLGREMASMLSAPSVREAAARETISAPGTRR